MQKLKHNAMDSIGDKTKQAKEWGGEKLSQIKGAVGKGTKWLSDKVGDIVIGLVNLANYLIKCLKRLE